MQRKLNSKQLFPTLSSCELCPFWPQPEGTSTSLPPKVFPNWKLRPDKFQQCNFFYIMPVAPLLQITICSVKDSYNTGKGQISPIDCSRFAITPFSIICTSTWAFVYSCKTILRYPSFFHRLPICCPYSPLQQTKCFQQAETPWGEAIIPCFSLSLLWNTCKRFM